MSFIDLHCHYLPGIDDGAKTASEGQNMLEGLRGLGFETVVATPHIRTAMFENRAPQLRAHFASFEKGPFAELDQDARPAIALAAEHYFDDVFISLLSRDEVLPYPGNQAILIEFHYEVWPRGVQQRIFDMQIRGLRPVIAHPERYAALSRHDDDLLALLDAGALALLDLMSLVGRYGERTQRTALRLLERGLYDAACSDSHRPDDIVLVEKSIEQLCRLDPGAVSRLLGENPRRILDGSYET